MTFKTLFIALFLSVFTWNLNSAFASVPPAPKPTPFKTIPTTPAITDPSDLLEYLVSIPDDKIDLLWANLVIDKYINPEINIEKTYRKVEAMATVIKKMAGKNASDVEKIAAIRMYVYTAGYWNNNQPFTYDFDNPQGRLAIHKTLDYYLTHKKGNCVSMPLLFLVLAEQLDVDMALITAPTHLQIRYTDPKTGKPVNLETTSGANPSRPEWLKTQIPPWTERSVETGMYLKTLTKQQMVGEMGTTILQRLFGEDKNWGEDIEVSIIILEVYPQSDIALLHVNKSTENELVQKYISKYPSTSAMPPEVQAKALSLMRMSDTAYQQLVHLGFKFKTRPIDIPLNQFSQPRFPNTPTNPAFALPSFSNPSVPNPNLLNPFPINPNTAPNPYTGLR